VKDATDLLAVCNTCSVQRLQCATLAASVYFQIFWIYKRIIYHPN
jgi:hypothetical protein